MQEQFPVALDVFVRGLRAGHPIAAALDLLTVEMPDPIGSQFGMVVDEVTYGAELRDALQAMAERWDLDDMRMFVVSLVGAERNRRQPRRDPRESVEGDPRAAVDDAEGPRAVERRPDDRDHADRLPIFAFTVLFIVNPRFYLDVADDPVVRAGLRRR